MESPLGNLPDTLEIHCHPEASVLSGAAVTAFIEDCDDFFGEENSRPGDALNHIEVWVKGIRPVDEVATTAAEMRSLIYRTVRPEHYL
jgi:hypothetical protein